MTMSSDSKSRDSKPLVVPLAPSVNKGVQARKVALPVGYVGVDVVKSEWIKIRTVRSTYRTLVAAAMSMVGICVIVCATFVARFDTLSPQDKNIDPVTVSLAGLGLAQLAIVVLGVLTITNEYTTGMIRSTFTAIPQRVTVLKAKALVLVVVVFLVTTTAAFLSFFLGQAVLSRQHLGIGIAAPKALRRVFGAGLYLSALSVLSLGLGTIIRRTAGAITAALGLLLMLPIMVSLLPSSAQQIRKYLPSNAGQEIVFGVGRISSDALSPWAGFGVLCLYAFGFLALGELLLSRRDV
jgi:ABC-2 type transport system permease protein